MIAFGMASCQKAREALPKDSPSGRTVPPSSIMSGDSYTALVNGVCTGSEDVCHVIPTVTIHGQSVDTSKLFFAELNGALAVSQVFSSSDYSAVCNYLSDDEVEKLRSGTYVIEITSQSPDHMGV